MEIKEKELVEIFMKLEIGYTIFYIKKFNKTYRVCGFKIERMDITKCVHTLFMVYPDTSHESEGYNILETFPTEELANEHCELLNKSSSISCWKKFFNRYNEKIIKTPNIIKTDKGIPYPKKTIRMPKVVKPKKKIKAKK